MSLPGFEQYTIDVTDSELGIINVIAKCLRRRIGAENSISNKEMRDKISDWKDGVKISDPKMRKYIQYIRVHGLVPMLCGGSSGYYVAKSYEEWVKYKESFRMRIRSMQFTMACMDLDVKIKKIT